MSLKNVEIFYDKLKNDAEFKSSIEKVLNELPRDFSKEVFDIKVFPELKKLGLEFTYEELKKFESNLAEKSLSEDSLEGVSGGQTCILFGSNGGFAFWVNEKTLGDLLG